MKLGRLEMRFKFYFSWLYFCSLLFCAFTSVTNEDGKMHVVYMGSSGDKGRDLLFQSHVGLLSSVLGNRNQAEQSLVRSYTYAFTGFSAILSTEAANALAEKPGVVSVFADPVLKLHTTQSWDFLQMKSSGIRGGSYPNPSSSGQEDVIIGLLDTGIWPEAPSFSGKGIGSVPSRWKGTCMKGKDFTRSNCNSKIIGARYYDEGSESEKSGSRKSIWTKSMTPRDESGHGTHTASTAAGDLVANANYHGLANGTARGGFPASRIAIYKVCSENGCQGSDILAAFDDAVKDGVDILSLSLGGPSMQFSMDPLAIGAFHAMQKGILVVCSAGNEGPDPQTVTNTAPWIFTVGATTINRRFQSKVVLGNHKTIQGEGISFSNLSQSKMYPLVYAATIPKKSYSSETASECFPGALDASKMKGKIVLCLNRDTEYTRLEKKNEIQSKRGIGMILVDDTRKYVATNYGTFPSATVGSKSGNDILSYVNSTRKPVATITTTEAIQNYKPAPVVAYFSSRGPGGVTENILKPDISAPGVNILAAYIPTSRKKSSSFDILSGTSMACPHVSGAAAFVKSYNPTWSSSALRSALITTATSMNNMGNAMTDDSDMAATPFDFGAGEINPMGALQPGLVYETTTEDYFLFLCNSGMDSEDIKTISGNDSYKCPSNAHEDLISDMNYPTIAIAMLDQKGKKTITRSVTNVSPDKESTYKVSINVPQGLNVKVSPDTLRFSKVSNKLSFQVTFTPSAAAAKGYAFGSLTWADGKHNVRTPFAVNIV